MSERDLKTSCHCGAVTVGLPQAPAWALQCGCSICRKLGALWAYYPDAEVQVAGATATYVCNNRVIAFHRCRDCGCTTHWQTLGTDFGRMGVNVRLLDSDVLAAVEVRAVAGPSPDNFKD